MIRFLKERRAGPHPQLGEGDPEKRRGEVSLESDGDRGQGGWSWTGTWLPLGKNETGVL